MKKIIICILLFISLSLAFSTPWVDDIFLAVETESPKKIQRIIETDYSFKDYTRGEKKENLLMAALQTSRENNIINLLLKQAKISPDKKTKDDVTSLMYACQYENYIDAVQNVLFTGASKDKKKAERILATDKNGQNCFDYARKNNTISAEVLELLNKYAQEPVAIIEAEAEEVPETPPVEENPVEEEPEPIETFGESKEFLKEDSEEQAEITQEVSVDVNSLIDLSLVNSPDISVESIYLYDYAKNTASALVIPPALIAAEEAQKRFINDYNKPDSQGRSPLMLAAKEGDIKKIEDLLYSGADLNLQDDEGWTALMYAARFQKNADVTTLLLYKGADRQIKNKYGITALMLAAGYSKNDKVLSALLESYPVNSEETRQALSYGISNLNSPEVLQAFVDKKVSLNIPYKGKTPLIIAAESGNNTKTIEWLLNNGASKYIIEDATNKTAFDYAKTNKKLPHNSVFWSLNPENSVNEIAGTESNGTGS